MRKPKFARADKRYRVKGAWFPRLHSGVNPVTYKYGKICTPVGFLYKWEAKRWMKHNYPRSIWTWTLERLSARAVHERWSVHVAVLKGVNKKWVMQDIETIT